MIHNAATSLLFSSQQDSLITSGASTESILIKFYMPLKKYSSRDSVPSRSLFLIKFTKFILPYCLSVSQETKAHEKKFSLNRSTFFYSFGQKGKVFDYLIYINNNVLPYGIWNVSSEVFNTRNLWQPAMNTATRLNFWIVFYSSAKLFWITKVHTHTKLNIT